jgi:hypothetical protein
MDLLSLDETRAIAVRCGIDLHAAGITPEQAAAFERACEGARTAKYLQTVID